MAQGFESGISLKGDCDITGKYIAKLGASTAKVRARGLAWVNTTPAANYSTFGTDLHTYTLPLNGMPDDGDTLWYEASGTYASNNHTKALLLAFGNEIVHVYNGVPVGTHWCLRARITRTGSSSQVWEVEYLNDGGASLGGMAMVENHLTGRVTSAVSFGSALDLIVNGEGEATNDIIQTESYVVIGGVP